MSQKIRVRINISKPHLEFANDAVTVYAGLKDNPRFPANPPVALDVFNTKIDAYRSAIASAEDGSRRAMTERNKLKDELATMMRHLGHWVEANCGQDPATFASSGFPSVSAPRVSQGPLAAPVILKTQNGTVSGQINLQITPLPGARNYEVQYAPIGADGTTGAWTKLPPFASSRGISVTGLTPGATYLFQVRAFSKAGLTDWSDAVSRIAV